MVNCSMGPGSFITCMNPKWNPNIRMVNVSNGLIVAGSATTGLPSGQTPRPVGIFTYIETPFLWPSFVGIHIPYIHGSSAILPGDVSYPLDKLTIFPTISPQRFLPRVFSLHGTIGEARRRKVLACPRVLKTHPWRSTVLREEGLLRRDLLEVGGRELGTQEACEMWVGIIVYYYCSYYWWLLLFMIFYNYHYHVQNGLVLLWLLVMWV